MKQGSCLTGRHNAVEKARDIALKDPNSCLKTATGNPCDPEDVMSYNWGGSGQV